MCPNQGESFELDQATTSATRGKDPAVSTSGLGEIAEVNKGASIMVRNSRQKYAKFQNTG